MSIIKVTLPPGEIPAEGKQVSFKAPCTCTVTDGIQIEGVDYTVCDALGKCVTGIGGVWDVDSIVSVILSPEQKKAYVQNNAGYSPNNKPPETISKFVTGTYTGNNASSQTISLGFTPKFVMVARFGSIFYNSGNKQHQGGFAVSGTVAKTFSGSTLVSIANGGFVVYYSNTSVSSYYYGTNEGNSLFNYIALA